MEITITVKKEDGTETTATFRSLEEAHAHLEGFAQQA